MLCDIHKVLCQFAIHTTPWTSAAIWEVYGGDACQQGAHPRRPAAKAQAPPAPKATGFTVPGGMHGLGLPPSLSAPPCAQLAGEGRPAAEGHREACCPPERLPELRSSTGLYGSSGRSGSASAGSAFSYKSLFSLKSSGSAGRRGLQGFDAAAPAAVSTAGPSSAAVNTAERNLQEGRLYHNGTADHGGGDAAAQEAVPQVPSSSESPAGEVSYKRSPATSSSREIFL